MRTEQEIVDQTNAIARIIYASRGYKVEDDFVFHIETVNRHPYERSSWQAACEIQLLMTQTDPNDSVDNLDDECSCDELGSECPACEVDN